MLCWLLDQINHEDQIGIELINKKKEKKKKEKKKKKRRKIYRDLIRCFNKICHGCTHYHIEEGD